MGKLLIVDDDEVQRRLMYLELSDTHEIIDSEEPKQALALAIEHKPDAILLDPRNPEYSGDDLLRTFTSLVRTKTIPVIVVSGKAGGQTEEHWKELGASAYFDKPIDFDKLRNHLRHFVLPHYHVTRSEARMQLRVTLKLCGTDSQQKKFEETATTENTSISGFLCDCTSNIPTGSIVDVYLTSPQETYVGKAKIVYSRSKSASIRHYGCHFMDKTGPWVLQ